jgi:hypothetical protein
MAVPWNDEAREFRQTSGRILFAGSEREYRSRYPTLPVLTVGPKPLGSRKSGGKRRQLRGGCSWTRC